MALQLFPPAPKKPRKEINLSRPQKAASPEPDVELLDRAKAPADFHELIIKVNSNPNSPVSTPPAARVAASNLGKSAPKVVVPKITTTSSSSSSPATRTLRSAGGTTPSSSTTTGHSPDTKSPEQQTPLSGTTNVSPVSQVERNFTASPSFSEATTLARNQSTATRCTKKSQTSPKEQPVMRSIFPRYNPEVRLSQQDYQPTQASPTHIPKEKIHRKPYSPTFYVPHSNVSRSGSAQEPYYTPKIELGALYEAANGKARPEAWRTYSLQMHHRKGKTSNNSPAIGNSEYSIADEAFVFGPSPTQPLYTLEQALAERDRRAKPEDDPGPSEVLITRAHPVQPKSKSLPVAHMEIEAPPPHRPPPPPEYFYQHPDDFGPPRHIATIHPKMATLAALEAASQSPRAADIASFDPRAESEAAAALAADAVAAAEAQNACALHFCAVSEPLCAPYEMHRTGTYELRHPSLGAFPVVVQGDVKRSLDAFKSSAQQANGSSGGRSSPPTTANTIPTTITMLNPFATPRTPPSAEPSSTSKSPPARTTSPTNRPPTPAPDEVLARLSLPTAALTVDAAAIAALGTERSSADPGVVVATSPHPHMVDVAVSAVLAVLVAETRRAGDAMPVLVLPAAPPPGALPNAGAAGAGGGAGGAAGGGVVYGAGQWPTTGGGLMVFEGPPTAAARAWPGSRKSKREKRASSLSALLRGLGISGVVGGGKGKVREIGDLESAGIELQQRGQSQGQGVSQGVGVGQGVGARSGSAEGRTGAAKEEEGEKLHWLAELVLKLLGFAFKTVVFVLTVAIKIVARVVVGLSRCVAKA